MVSDEQDAVTSFHHQAPPGSPIAATRASQHGPWPCSTKDGPSMSLQSLSLASGGFHAEEDPQGAESQGLREACGSLALGEDPEEKTQLKPQLGDQGEEKHLSLSKSHQWRATPTEEDATGPDDGGGLLRALNRENGALALRLEESLAHLREMAGERAGLREAVWRLGGDNARLEREKREHLGLIGQLTTKTEDDLNSIMELRQKLRESPQNPERRPSSPTTTALESCADDSIGTLGHTVPLPRDPWIRAQDEEKRHLTRTIWALKDERDGISRSLDALKREREQVVRVLAGLKAVQVRLSESVSRLKEQKETLTRRLPAPQRGEEVQPPRSPRTGDEEVAPTEKDEEAFGLKADGDNVTEKNRSPSTAETNLMETKTTEGNAQNTAGSSTGQEESDGGRALDATQRQLKESQEELDRRRAEMAILRQRLSRAEAARENAEKKSFQAGQEVIQLRDLAHRAEEIRQENQCLVVRYEELQQARTETDDVVLPLKAKLSSLAAKCQERNHLLAHMLNVLHQHGLADSALTRRADRLLRDAAPFVPGSAAEDHRSSPSPPSSEPGNDVADPQQTTTPEQSGDGCPIKPHVFNTNANGSFARLRSPEKIVNLREELQRTLLIGCRAEVSREETASPDSSSGKKQRGRARVRRPPGGPFPEFSGTESASADEWSDLSPEKISAARPRAGAPAQVHEVEVIKRVGRRSLLIGWERPTLDELGRSNGTFVYGYRVFWDGQFYKSAMSSACTKCVVENVDLSGPVEIGVQTLGSNGLSSKCVHTVYVPPRGTTDIV